MSWLSLSSHQNQRFYNSSHTEVTERTVSSASHVGHVTDVTLATFNNIIIISRKVVSCWTLKVLQLVTVKHSLHQTVKHMCWLCFAADTNKLHLLRTELQLWLEIWSIMQQAERDSERLLAQTMFVCPDVWNLWLIWNWRDSRLQSACVCLLWLSGSKGRCCVWLRQTSCLGLCCVYEFWIFPSWLTVTLSAVLEIISGTPEHKPDSLKKSLYE